MEIKYNIYVQMPHENNLHHGAVNALEIVAKDKNATFTLSINKKGKWIVRSGLLKSTNDSFIQAVREFILQVYPNINE